MFYVFEQKTAYEMRISDWSSDVCSSDLLRFESSDGGNRCARGGDQHPVTRQKRQAAEPPVDFIAQAVAIEDLADQCFQIVGIRFGAETEIEDQLGIAGNDIAGDRKSTRLNSSH